MTTTHGKLDLLLNAGWYLSHGITEGVHRVSLQKGSWGFYTSPGATFEGALASTVGQLFAALPSYQSELERRERAQALRPLRWYTDARDGLCPDAPK